MGKFEGAKPLQELMERLEYLKRVLEKDELRLKDKDRPLWRETLDRFWELTDVLEWKGEIKI